MQREFTIQIRVDYADVGKNAAMEKAMQIAARRLLATARMLTDQTEPQASLFSDDFFTAHKEIAIIHDGLAERIEAGGEDDIEEPVSSELLDALKASVR